MGDVEELAQGTEDYDVDKKYMELVVRANERRRKIGKLFIPSEWLITKYDLVRDIMSKVIVVRAEMLFERDGFEYTVMCDEFSDVPAGYIPPDYKIYEGDGGWSFR